MDPSFTNSLTPVWSSWLTRQTVPNHATVSLETDGLLSVISGLPKPAFSLIATLYFTCPEDQVDGKDSPDTLNAQVPRSAVTQQMGDKKSRTAKYLGTYRSS